MAGPPSPAKPPVASPADGVDVAGGHRLAVEGAGRGSHHPDPLVASVGDQQVAGGVCRHARRAVELGAGGRAAVAGEPDGAVAGDGVDVAGGHRLAVEGAGRGSHHPDPLVAAVGDQQVPGAVHRHARRAEFGAGGRAAVAGEPGGAVPGDGVDVAGGHRLAVEGAGRGGHHPEPVVAAVGDQQVAGVVRRGPARGRQACPGPATAIAERAGLAGTGGGGQPVGARVHRPHRPAAGDVQAPGTERHPARRHGNRGGPGRAADPPGHRRDHPGRARRGRR